MLIVLSDDILEGDFASPAAEPVRRALANLALAHREGKHILSFSLKFQRKLRLFQQQMGTDIGAIYETWDRDHAQALRERVVVYIEVHEAGHPFQIVRPSDPAAPLVFHVDIDYFRDSMRVQAAQLVGEDLRDADLYHCLARAYAGKNSTQVRLRCVAGGGESTGKVFRWCGEEGIALCVVDTDATDSTGPPKKTAVFAMTALESLEKKGLVTDLHLLPCHELENIWPERLVRGAAERDGQQTLDLVDQHSGRFGRVDYADLKKLVGGKMIVWVAKFIERMNPGELAEYCLADGQHPYLATLGRLLWSWGACPPGGKRRV